MLFMYNLKKLSNQYILSQSHPKKWNKIPTHASILIILTYPMHMKYSVVDTIAENLIAITDKSITKNRIAITDKQ